MADEKKDMTRRGLLKRLARGLVGAGLGYTVAASAMRSQGEETVWQIDPSRCVQCGRCATECVLGISAVKCVHAFDVCGYCDLCFAYFRPGTKEFDTGAEKQLCPTFAITRNYIEKPYFEYTIDEEKCNGCAKCVKGCQTFGNGSLYLQVRHDRCVGCNQCSIADSCPSGALSRVPASSPYVLKGVDGKKGGNE